VQENPMSGLSTIHISSTTGSAPSGAPAPICWPKEHRRMRAQGDPDRELYDEDFCDRAQRHAQ
jgi:hypothetical protein